MSAKEKNTTRPNMTVVREAAAKPASRHHEGQVIAGTIQVPPFQRPLRPRLVREIVRNFDPDKFKALIVSKRADGTHWVVDGRHRLQAVLDMGWADQNVPCLIYEGLSYAGEVQLFRSQAISVAITPPDYFRAALEERDPEAMAIKAIVEARGFHISLDGNSRGGKGLNCIAALRDTYQDGADLLREVVQVLVSVYGDSEHTYNSNEVRGFARFLRWYPTASRDRLVVAARKLGTVGMNDGIVLHTRMSRGMDKATAFAAVLHNAYNTGLRSRRLPTFDPAAQRTRQGNLTRYGKGRDEDRMKDAR